MRIKKVYALSLLLLFIYIVSYTFSVSYLLVNTSVALRPYQINMEFYNPMIKTISAENENKVLLKLGVLSRDGFPINYVKVRFNSYNFV